jgi:hypothetical protein
LKPSDYKEITYNTLSWALKFGQEVYVLTYASIFANFD